ncbi:MAG: threonylcarbamoyl-AMP synthase [Sphingobacteriales bacterium]|nr:MAG: threonylcarbamoyl-AMP synthase [Sphingobacteriales bacterium]
METIIGKDIEKAAALLQNNEVVAVPTETVYGLAANALNPEAVTKIFEAKNRPFFDPLIIHIPEKSHIYKYVKMLLPELEKLADAFWPGPLTLVCPTNDCIPDIVTSGLDTVGIRVPAHPLFNELLHALPFPLAAPSANPFGYISPTSAQHVYNQLQNKISYILDGGNALVGVESTIVGYENNRVIVYRLGGIAVEEIEKIVGKVEVQIHSSNPTAPGQLDSHYSPRKPFFAGDIYALLEKYFEKKAGVISFKDDYENANIVARWKLSASGNMNEAAQNLFAFMREADASEAEIIIAEYLPETGLGLAINDRLKRASFK